jgi:hypothetical protein
VIQSSGPLRHALVDLNNFIQKWIGLMVAILLCFATTFLVDWGKYWTAAFTGVVICMWTAPMWFVATITLRRFVAGSGRRPPHQNPNGL